MDWINMSDRDKLYHYAKDFKPTSSRIIKLNDNVESYYIDCEDGGNIHDLAIMEYDVEHLVQFKKCLIDMWNHVGFKEANLLATIVAATALKNMPPKVDNDTLHSKSVEKESYESVNTQDTPPVFVYEF